MAPFLWLAVVRGEQTHAVAEGKEETEEEEEEEKLGVIPSKPKGALGCFSDSWGAQIGQNWSSVGWEEVMQEAPSVKSRTPWWFATSPQVTFQ